MKAIVVEGKEATQAPVALPAGQAIEAAATNGELKPMFSAPEPDSAAGRDYAASRFQYIRRKMREGLINDEDC